MPTATLYDLSIPVLIRGLENLNSFLKKGEKWAQDNNVAVEKLLEGKLAEDMKALAFQVQTCSNTAKFTAVRVGGVANEVWEDDETTFAQLYARIDKTLAFIRGVNAESFVGKEEAEVVMKLPNKDYHFTGLSYVQNFVLPNFFFHESMAYAILRKEGVPVGKFDYLGSV